MKLFIVLSLALGALAFSSPNVMDRENHALAKRQCGTRPICFRQGQCPRGCACVECGCIPGDPGCAVSVLPSKFQVLAGRDYANALPEGKYFTEFLVITRDADIRERGTPPMMATEVRDPNVVLTVINCFSTTSRVLKDRFKLGRSSAGFSLYRLQEGEGIVLAQKFGISSRPHYATPNVIPTSTHHNYGYAASIWREER
ncbi:hypothetical protein BKA65DRAFT_485608 [Rhexocercosporidium sp. MPI-PUGE-AT-0058]|nr:hypothetical protein BKA65DRAFT_485608 [Rhexocercosporidium sp. MPI-PUGE-AT-0058]